MTDETVKPGDAAAPGTGTPTHAPPTSISGSLGESAEAGSEPNTLTPRAEPAGDTNRANGYADFHHGYVSQYIQLADAKAGATFALTSGVTAFLLNSSDFVVALRLGAAWPVTGLAIMAFALLVLSSIFSFLVIVPRLPKGGDSLVFFGSVANLPNANEFVGRIASLSDGALLAERLSHSYNLSVVCARKYRALSRSMWLAGAALFVTFVYWLTAGG